MKSLRNSRRIRMETALWGEVQRVGEENARVLVEELSEDGLRFRCGQEISMRLMPSGRRAPGALHGVRVWMKFPLPGLQKPVEILCRLVFCRRFAQDSFRFDCEFDPQESLKQQRIEAFLRRRMESGELPEPEVGVA